MKNNKIWFIVLLVAFVFITACGGGGGGASGGGSGDTTAPTVSSSTPSNGTTGVGTNSKISAAFSEAMNPATLTGATFTLTQGGAPVAGAVTYVGTVATFNPDSDLTGSLVYVATITAGAKDLAGNAAVNKTWSFTTGPGTDTTAPTVSSSSPADLDTGVAVNANIAASFSEAMDPATIDATTFTLTQGGTPVPGAVTYVGTVATFNPTSNLTGGLVYDATITTGAKDLAGNAAVLNTWSFTTGPGPDTTAPTVGSLNPADTDIGVVVNGNITAAFSETMDPATITTATFTLTPTLGGAAVEGAVTCVGAVATFKPKNNLTGSTQYTATITTGVKDLAGNALAATKTWRFTTGATAALGPETVNLGTAGNFVILSKSGITNVPTSAITGNIGTSPITGAAITSLDCVQVVGSIYTVDAAGPACRTTDASRLSTAIGDMQIAYTDAAGRPTPDTLDVPAGGNISGYTIAPGLYKWTSGVSTDATGFTITGGANDIWIFQIAGNLTVANNAIITLGGAAQAKNIFWQVAGQTTIGTSAQFKGIILCKTLIAMQTGAPLITTLNGRALAQTAVTLQMNTVTHP